MTRVSLDYTNMMAPGLGEAGVDSQELEGALSQAFAEAHAEVEDGRNSQEMGFFELPGARENAETVQGLADSFGQ